MLNRLSAPKRRIQFDEGILDDVLGLAKRRPLVNQVPEHPATLNVEKRTYKIFRAALVHKSPTDSGTPTCCRATGIDFFCLARL